MPTKTKKTEDKPVKAKPTVVKHEVKHDINEVKEVKKEKVETEVDKKRVRHSYLFAVGRRKTAVARVRLFKKGEGKITVNGKEFDTYFPTAEMKQIIIKPLEVVGKLKDFDFSIKTNGGGLHGQAEAVCHGIARALVIFDKDLRAVLKPHDLMRRDPRRKERKKPGLKKARRGSQWAKR